MKQLEPYSLLAAYANGYFPMADEEKNQIHWFNPDPRAIIELDHFHVSRSLRKRLRNFPHKSSFSQDFREVMRGCADRPDTWISEEFIDIYCKLHEWNAAHSVEVWCDDRLVGGVYGVVLGGAFFAESMFSKVTDGSKMALFYLVERLREKNFQLLECQFITPHLQSMGASELPKEDYLARLTKSLKSEVSFL